MVWSILHYIKTFSIDYVVHKVAEGIAIPLESQPRFERNAHKQKNGLWVFLSKRKNPQGIIR